MKFYCLTLGTLLVVCLGCVADGQHHAEKSEFVAPPAAQLAAPGPMVAGPGPGVMGPITQVGYNAGPGGAGGYNAGPGGAAGPYCGPAGVPGEAMGPMVPAAGGIEKSQVRFLGPEGMVIGWQIGEVFAESQLTAPSRYNFVQGATYRLKLSNIPGRDGLTLYPTLTIYPSHPTTAAYLDHNPVPLRLTDEDLDQVETNNFVSKVVYLPDPRFQDLAIAGVEELVSTRLDPGLDPVAEADRRGTIMAVLRVGNLDLEMPGQDLVSQNGAGSHIRQVQYSGETGQFIPPQPVAAIGGPGGPVPMAPIVAGHGAPGQPVAMPVWGQPFTGTPIGLPGPPHLPLGRPAGLQRHTMRNLTDVDVGEPVDDLLIDVRHEPGIKMPHPVRHIEYTETHPLYRDGALSYPASSGAF